MAAAQHLKLTILLTYSSTLAFTCQLSMSASSVEVQLDDGKI